MKKLILLPLLFGLLAGCSNLPASGPTASMVVEPTGTEVADLPYEVIDVTESDLPALRNRPVNSFAGRFSSHAPAPSQALSVGDQVVITIFEAAGGGLFSNAAPMGTTSAGSRNIALPPQTVDRDGSLTVPYAGRVPAAGRTPAAVAKAIEAKLKDKAIEPQVIVSTQGNGAAATVTGDATGAARVALSLKGDRLLDVIAQAGGVKTLPHETKVRLTRGSTSESALLETILKDPKEDVYVYPGDKIYVYRDAPVFVALGAVAAQKDYPIDDEPMTLLQAVAKAGGLIDTQADSSAVFLFRREAASVVRALRPNSTHLAGNEPVPVIYRLRFDKAGDYFSAQQITVRDKDMIYVANAPAVQFSKFVTVIRGVTSTVGAFKSTATVN